jgi:hypothetical protein
MSIALVVSSALLLASALSQPPFPGAVQIDGGWVPCDHPIALAAGSGCPVAPTPPNACPKVIADYYVLLACAPRPPLPVNPWTKGTFSFEVGTLYGWTYPSSDRLLVIGVALDIDSLRRIVTGRRLKAGLPFGGPVVFYEDESGGWVPLPPGESK